MRRLNNSILILLTFGFFLLDNFSAFTLQTPEPNTDARLNRKNVKKSDLEALKKFQGKWKCISVTSLRNDKIQNLDNFSGKNIIVKDNIFKSMTKDNVDLEVVLIQDKSYFKVDFYAEKKLVAIGIASLDKNDLVISLTSKSVNQRPDSFDLEKIKSKYKDYDCVLFKLTLQAD